MKAILVFCTLQLFCLQGFSQFALHTVLPMGVSGIAYGDTLLNTRVLLQREGIKKITAYHTSSRDGHRSSFTTTYTVTDGRITSRTWCYHPAPDSAIRFCLRDTLLYNSRGQMVEYWSGGGKDSAFMRMMIAYANDTNARVILVVKDPRKAWPDTTVYRQVYSGKRQLVSQQYDPNSAYSVNATLSYNPDGLVDSIRHENTSWGTYVFKRSQKRKKTVLTLETAAGSYQWEYNAAGQCLASEWTSKFRTRMPNGDREKMIKEVTYSYHDDGTLLKVVEDKGSYKETTVYTYGR